MSWDFDHAGDDAYADPDYHKIRVAIDRCTHDLCMCGERNARGEVIGYDTPVGPGDWENAA